MARGETIFNSTQINITGVVGLNDVLGQQSIPGFCGTCHDTPNVGNHSVKAPLNIGIANAGPNSPPALDISGLPVFMLSCTSGPLTGQSFIVTDAGRALISGKCADIGKIKGPILRGLVARAPLFPQRLGCDPFRRRRILQPAFQSRFHRATEKRSRRIPENLVGGEEVSAIGTERTF